MIAYNRQWIDNLALHKKAKVWLKKNQITAEEYQNIIQQHVTQYHEPNIFGRIGMFIFSVIIISATIGLLNVFLDLKIILVQLILAAAGTLFTAEYFFRENKYYRSGITDALIYTGLLFASSVMIMIADGNKFNLDADPLIYLILITPLFILATLRYADTFLALISFVLVIVINALIVLKAGFIGKLVLPFETMILSYIIYLFIRKHKLKSEYRFWRNCISMSETLSVVTFYLSGNYLVVRKLSELLLNAEFPPGTDISFSWFFYAFTIIVPIIIIWRGLTTKDYILIRSGLILEVIGILSIRYYYSILPAEYALTLGGFVMVAIAWISIKYLKTPRNGITFEDTNDTRKSEIEILSSLVIAQATSNLKAPDSGTKFGGGESGGGGAGGDY